MRIEPISGLLQSGNLKYPSLSVLEPSMNLYSALLVQPEARIQVREDFIRNSDRAAARKMFAGIAKEASDRNVDLFVTPEYSCPWETLEDLFRAGVAPAAGKLWILGCESLPLADLAGLKGRYLAWADVLHETLPPQPTTVRYLNPLVYVFRTERVGTNESRVTMVVQFKTTPSGDDKNIEVTRMARGNDVYLFERGNEVRLISLICSDAFSFTDALVDANYENLLLVHIQLNDKPRQEAYMRYRRRLYEFTCDTTEVICLNWAEGISYDLLEGSAPAVKNNISASAWHSKSGKFATDDAHVEKNHGYGVYYTRDQEQHRHMLHFKYKPAAFILETTKVRHHAVPAPLSRRRGPELTQVLEWDGAADTWKAALHPADDGFQAMTVQYGESLESLHAGEMVSPLALERISCITSGNFGPMRDWYSVDKLPTLRLQPRTEVVLRVSVAHDPDGHNSRDEYMRTLRALASADAATLPLPERMKDIRGGFKFSWTGTAANGNVKSAEAGSPATLIYAGENPLQGRLAGMHAKARATTSNTTLADRFCVFYREGQHMKRFDPPLDRSITKTDVLRGKNFTEPEK